MCLRYYLLAKYHYGSNDTEKQKLLEISEEKPQGLLRSLAAPFTACIEQCFPALKTDVLDEKRDLQIGRKDDARSFVNFLINSPQQTQIQPVDVTLPSGVPDEIKKEMLKCVELTRPI